MEYYRGQGVSERIEQAHVAALERRAYESRLSQSDSVRYGAPSQMTDTPLHQQGLAPDCLLQCARMAEHRQTGRDPGLVAFKQPAIEQNIYNQDGVTDVDKFVSVLNDRDGVQAEGSYAASPEAILDSLNQRKSVIVGVNAYEYYKVESNLEPNSGGHALLVTGAERQDNGRWQFTVNDPNQETPNFPVDGERLLPAWKAEGNLLITVEKRAGGQDGNPNNW
ncbi:MAG: hypothetical protein H6646_00250 [Anaerolineales bacterium]|nr:hypothetical protein [Caldilinea sp.]MCB0147396.1 hypothetical protein [Caldilineaceae bacterium]MCB9120369.1 hypothetical protein [Caldilineaceae bacterium]MCB9140680.1 hypothetical protein [Anaerolineales bacterium]